MREARALQLPSPSAPLGGSGGLETRLVSADAHGEVMVWSVWRRSQLQAEEAVASGARREAATRKQQAEEVCTAAAPGAPQPGGGAERARVPEPPDLAGLHALKTLHLGRTRVSNDGLFHLRGLTKLKSLTLDDTRVGNAGIKHLSGLKEGQEFGEASRSKDAPKIYFTDWGIKNFQDQAMKNMADEYEWLKYVQSLVSADKG